MSSHRDSGTSVNDDKSADHVLFINRSYWPDAEATGQLLTELCEGLANRFKVTVVCGQPNRNPAGETFPKSGALVRNGVTIRRVRHTRFAKRSFVGRILNFLTFLWSATFRSLFLQRPKAVIVETDPFILPFLGLILSWRYRCPLVVYLQDIHPDAGMALGKIRNSFLVRRLRASLFAVYRRAERIVVLSHDMKRLLVRSEIGESKVQVIPNWADTQKIVPVKVNNRFRQSLNIGDKLLVAYSGNLGLCQGLERIVPTLTQMSPSEPAEVVLIGDGVLKQEMQQIVAKAGVQNFRFLDYQPVNQLAESLSSADVHLVPLDERIFECLMPSKLYGVLASGTAVLAVAPLHSELAQIVLEHRCGLVVAPNDAEGLLTAVKWCSQNRTELDEMGQRARQVAETLLNRENSTDLFETLLEDLVNPAAIAGDQVENGLELADTSLTTIRR